jgi:hypothetical protein
MPLRSGVSEEELSDSLLFSTFSLSESKHIIRKRRLLEQGFLRSHPEETSTRLVESE